MDLDTVADELYGLPPGEFTAARALRASEAKKAGDRALATSIGGLRRPSKSAWLVNILARRQRELVGELLEVGHAMREAQAQLAGGDIRTLSRRRHGMISALATKAPDIAAAAGETLSDGTLRELGATLAAASADEAAGEAVRAGRLTAALSHSGFGSGELVPAPASGSGGSHGSGSSRAPGNVSAVAGATAKRALAEADKRAADARAEVDDREARAAAAEEESARVSREIAALETDLALLRRDAIGAALSSRDAGKALDSARRILRSAEQQLDRASMALAQLEA